MAFCQTFQFCVRASQLTWSILTSFSVVFSVHPWTVSFCPLCSQAPATSFLLKICCRRLLFDVLMIWPAHWSYCCFMIVCACSTTSVSGVPFDIENSPKTGRMKVIEFSCMALIGSPRLFHKAGNLQLNRKIESMSIPHRGLKSSKALLGFRDLLGQFIIDTVGDNAANINLSTKERECFYTFRWGSS